MFPLTPQHERTMYWMRPGVDNYTNKKSFESESLKLSSIKQDLARSCFQLSPKIGDEDDKSSRKKTGEALAETVFSRNFVTLGADFEGRN